MVVQWGVITVDISSTIDWNKSGSASGFILGLSPHGELATLPYTPLGVCVCKEHDNGLASYLGRTLSPCTQC